MLITSPIESLSTGLLPPPLRRREWLAALAFTGLWFGLLQTIAHLWFGTAPRAPALALDLVAHLVLGALLFALSPGLGLFIPAIASLLGLLHLANAAKVAVLGAPIMPDDLAALRSLFLVMDGWQRLGATAAVLLTVGLLLATLRPTSRGGRTALVVFAPAVLTL